ncbi:MAG TPA: hypothetical protein VMT61_08870 [Candidatus Binataceae bacterium]|nr:hypothetical protein [Candidatus Binataceae bacterium]
MKLQFVIEQADLDNVHNLVTAQAEALLVIERQHMNVVDNKAEVTRERFWEVLVKMRLTTLQDSGPESAVTLFSKQQPFPLSYAAIGLEENVEEFIKQVFEDHNLKRFKRKIPSDLAENWHRLRKDNA